MEIKDLTERMLKNNKNLDGIYRTTNWMRLPCGGMWASGTIVFFHNGKVHREEGPAILSKDKPKTKIQYVKNGEIFREKGPTTIEYYSSWVELTEDFNVVLLPKFKDNPKWWSRITYSSEGNLHSLKHESINEPCAKTQKQYFIHGQKYKKKEWENHPLVIAERNKEELKNKVVNI